MGARREVGLEGGENELADFLLRQLLLLKDSDGGVVERGQTALVAQR